MRVQPVLSGPSGACCEAEPSIHAIYDPETLGRMAQARFQEERRLDRLDGWLRIKEIQRAADGRLAGQPPMSRAALTLQAMARELPLSLSEHAVFAGSQDDAFARSYALINPAFKVDAFTGYCDPTAVFGDVTPNAEFPQARISALRDYAQTLPFTRQLQAAYALAGDCTHEAVFFIEQVTGHMIPDFRTVLREGVVGLLETLHGRRQETEDPARREGYAAMGQALEAVLILASRYADLCRDQLATAQGPRKQALALMERTLRRVPARPAYDLYSAIQAFLLLWQVMCLEQAPNPFAFSVGNADRLFEPYRRLGPTSQAESTALFKHFLVFFNVADRSWAISQNVLVGGRSNRGEDLSSPSSYALLDAYFAMNLPQPILSVKLHRNTPPELYRQLGRFFFTPGMLTPSLFNDDALFQVLARSGIAAGDLEDYAVAGCQEPLVMGKDNGNTTNSWLNLAKILELTLQDGVSAITGQKLGLSHAELGMPARSALERLGTLRTAFYAQTEGMVDRMVAAANAASRAIALLPVPFLSAFMGGAETGIDTRDDRAQGTTYNGSGCLIHGLSVVADAFVAVDQFLAERPKDAERLIAALRTDFVHDEDLRQYLRACPKFGNHVERVDREARVVAQHISRMVAGKRNYLGNPFRPDWSTPSTHLLYGHWVGATPDGRKAREMLGYGVDPLYGEADSGLGFRVLSTLQLPFELMNGGYASHFGIDPAYFRGPTFEAKGLEFQTRIIAPLFFGQRSEGVAPFYLYVNVTTPDALRRLLADPARYAPSGVYIVRIHGTFVNFLDLSPEIQQDIIQRLDLRSTALA